MIGNLRELVDRLDVADPGELAEQLFVLVDGVIAAAVSGRADAARTAPPRPR
ncbi:hypothetical protein ABT324_30595 [Saccharopolyspora sp. NPDC000359]|uniref:hypothetical protein n=1 Tax=Saccharopolyspora sp. NPDC000359 TaxID=3154251 RepID=UPI003317AB05